jgi:hypothetical protein
MRNLDEGGAAHVFVVAFYWLIGDPKPESILLADADPKPESILLADADPKPESILLADGGPKT